MKAWYFDAYEVTQCDLLAGSAKSFASCIRIRRHEKTVRSYLIAETFEKARTGRIKILADRIEEKRREIELAQGEITAALTLLNDAIADDGVRDDEPPAP